MKLYNITATFERQRPDGWTSQGQLMSFVLTDHQALNEADAERLAHGLLTDIAMASGGSATEFFVNAVEI